MHDSHFNQTFLHLSLHLPGADPLRAGCQQWSFDQSFWVVGVVGAAVAGSRDAPDVTGVLAKWMTGQAGSLQLVEAAVAAGQRSTPLIWY